MTGKAWKEINRCSESQPEIDTQTCGQLINDKERKNTQWRKDSLFKK